MHVPAHLSDSPRTAIFRNPAIRTGIFCGAAISLAFLAWVIVANQLPSIAKFALPRNLAAAVVLACLASVPVFRFFRTPDSLVASGLISWAIFAFFYRVLCLFYSNLSEWHGAFQIFMYGVVVYMIVATLCWIGSIFWRARSHHMSHSNHHAG